MNPTNQIKNTFVTQTSQVLVILAILLSCAFYTGPAAAAKFSAIAVDARTGKILFARNADARRYPASLTKMMTLYLVFEDLRAGRLSLNTPLRVSRYAASRPPSKIGFKPGGTIRVRDAIGALVTKSANDVATAFAENLAGSEQRFARRMTRTARRIGMTRTTFRNASGLPNRWQTTTARDMATLGLRLQRDFPRYYRYFSMRRFTYRGRRYGNHNRLLGRIRGVDGIKTGYTRASGFNLTSSARLGRKRVVAVVMGGRTGGARNRYMASLIKRMFRTKRLKSSSRIALVAGTPPGYKYRPAPTRVAKIQSKKTPLPRTKPQQINTVRERIKKPVVSNKPVVLAAKRQDRLKAETRQQPNGTTFKSAAIIDDDETDIIMNDEGSKAVVRATKTNLILPKRRRVGSTVKKSPTELVEKTSAPTNTAAAAHSKSWNIQIGAFPSRQTAKGRLAAAVKKARGKLRGKVPLTIEVKKGTSKFYRARFAGFNRSTARRTCRILAKRGIGCFALAPQS